jgi:hypothetical protein
VFCCFNNNYKITPAVFDVWMRLIESVPGCVLWLLSDNEVAERNLRREAQARNVEPERLVFAPRLKLADHLARYRVADLFLDTLPYNAHTTASDALWAGLPVLTCAGRAFAGRVAGSLSHAVGLPELITESLDEYEALALKLATDPELLGSFRERLARNRATAPLFDTQRFCRHIEAAYTEMWQIWERGEAPRAFAVEPQEERVEVRGDGIGRRGQVPSNTRRLFGPSGEGGEVRSASERTMSHQELSKRSWQRFQSGDLAGSERLAKDVLKLTRSSAGTPLPNIWLIKAFYLCRMGRFRDARSLSDLGTIYCADGTAAQMSPIFRCVGPTMRLKIETICARSPTR